MRGKITKPAGGGSNKRRSRLRSRKYLILIAILAFLAAIATPPTVQAIQNIDFLIDEKKFQKLLAPNKKNMSSLYKKLDNNFYAFLDTRDMKTRLRYKK